jgi:hypothetical protein
VDHAQVGCGDKRLESMEAVVLESLPAAYATPSPDIRRELSNIHGYDVDQTRDGGRNGRRVVVL